MKIIKINSDLFQVEDQRGRFSVYKNQVCDIVDNDGVCHLPMNTPMDHQDRTKAVYDLDQTTGHPLEIYFDAGYSHEIGRTMLTNNFKPSHDFVGYLVYTHNNRFLNCEVEYSLANGATTKDFLMMLVNKLYPKETFGNEGFKLLKQEHFVGIKWSHLTVDDLIHIWDSYHNPLNYTDMMFNKTDYRMTPKSDHPLHGMVNPNYRLYNVKNVAQDVEFTIVLFDEVVEYWNANTDDIMIVFSNYVNRVPVIGELIVGQDEYQVEDYLTDQYDWNYGDFLANFFENNNQYNDSVKSRIIKAVKSNQETN